MCVNEARPSQSLLGCAVDVGSGLHEGSTMDMHDDGYDLFRRAVVERDADAWATIAERYRHLLISWAVRCPAAQEAGEFYDDLADRALARAWAALSPERFATPSRQTRCRWSRQCSNASIVMRCGNSLATWSKQRQSAWCSSSASCWISHRALFWLGTRRSLQM